jgi:hypothetical protein
MAARETCLLRGADDTQADFFVMAAMPPEARGWHPCHPMLILEGGVVPPMDWMLRKLKERREGVPCRYTVTHLIAW